MGHSLSVPFMWHSAPPADGVQFSVQEWMEIKPYMTERHATDLTPESRSLSSNERATSSAFMSRYEPTPVSATSPLPRTATSTTAAAAASWSSTTSARAEKSPFASSSSSSPAATSTETERAAVMATVPTISPLKLAIAPATPMHALAPPTTPLSTRNLQGNEDRRHTTRHLRTPASSRHASPAKFHLDPSSRNTIQPATPCALGCTHPLFVRECMAIVFSFLDVRSRLTAVCRVCKDWHHAMKFWVTWEVTSFEQYVPTDEAMKSVVKAWLLEGGPYGLTNLAINKLTDEGLAALNQVTSLRQIDIYTRHTAHQDTPVGPSGEAVQSLISSLTNLKQLMLQRVYQLTTLDLSHNTALAALDLLSCKRLERVTGFSRQHELAAIHADECYALEEFVDVELLSEKLEHLSVCALDEQMQSFILPPHETIPEFRRLHLLAIDCQSITDEFMLSIACASGITNLTISLLDVSQQAFRRIGDMKGLRKLGLYDGEALEDDDLQCLLSLPKLDSLVLSYFPHITCACFRTFSRMSSLRQLSMVSCFSLTLDGIAQCTQLRMFDVFLDRMTDPNQPNVLPNQIRPEETDLDAERLSKLDNLRIVQFFGSLSAVGVSHLCSMRNLVSLAIGQGLDTSLQFPTAGFAPIGNMSDLQLLVLPPLADQSSFLPLLEPLQKLQRVEVREAPSEAERVRLFAKLPHLRTLKVLRFPDDYDMYFYPPGIESSDRDEFGDPDFSAVTETVNECPCDRHE